jgi:XapX domain-containing protein
MTTLHAIITGTIAGATFGFLHLPIPAPPTLAGLAGIIGIWIGYTIATRLRGPA